MKPIHVALLGHGTVGKGVYQTIQTHQDRLQLVTGRPVHISAILIEHPEKYTYLDKEITITTDIHTIVQDPDIDVVFEAIVGIEPAYTYLKKCLIAGKSIITANKEMFAHHGSELKQLAQARGTMLGYDATTAGGIPIIQTIQQLLQVNQIQKIQGILNGTSNYILTEMREQQTSFDTALKQAQELGYAEADPTNDIEGYDALYKLLILSELTFGEQPALKEIKRKGISDISAAHIATNQTNGKKIKHLATIQQVEGKLHASVEPISLTDTHPLYAIEGVNNAVNIETDLIGHLTLTGPGAGALPTASAMLEDFCSLFAKKPPINHDFPVIKV